MILKKEGSIEDGRGEETGLWMEIPTLNKRKVIGPLFLKLEVAAFNSARSISRVEKTHQTQIFTHNGFPGLQRSSGMAFQKKVGRRMSVASLFRIVEAIEVEQGAHFKQQPKKGFGGSRLHSCLYCWSINILNIL